MEKMTATNPTKSLSSEVAVSDTRGLEVWSVWATLTMLTVPRSPRSKQTMEKDKQPVIKEKQPVAKEKKKKSSVGAHIPEEAYRDIEAKEI